MNKKLRIQFLLAVFLMTTLGFADDITINATVNSTNITLNDILSYTVEIDGTNKIKHLPEPQGSNFLIVNGPFQSSNFQFINGKMSAKISYTWQLQPQAEGELIINGFSVQYEKKKYSADRIVVKVEKARYSSGSQNNSGKQNQSDQAENSTEGRIFIDAIPSKKSVYLGEQVIVEYKLIYNMQITNYGTEKLPEAKGFWVEELDEIKNPQSSKIVIDGNEYYAATIKRIALFPTQSGTLTLDPMITQCEVVLPKARRRSSSPFDSFFDDSFFGNSVFDRTAVKRVVSSPLSIDVKPLPAYQDPSVLPPVMENVQVSGNIDTTEILRDKALTLKYYVTGYGNINAVDFPKPELPDYVEVFPPKVNKVNEKKMKIKGSATYEYVIIPHQAGTLTIPPVDFTYYDPQKNKYQTLRSKKFDVMVKEDKNLVSYSTGLSKEEVRMLDQDIRYILKGRVQWRRIDTHFYQNNSFILINIISFLLVAVALVVKTHQKTIGSNPVLTRKSKALKKAQERLGKAMEQESGHSPEILDSVLKGFISDRLNLPEAGLSPLNIREVLSRKKVDENLVHDTFIFLENMELYKYSPGATGNLNEQVLADTCKNLLARLSKVI
ncbi:MAG: protein BatD [Candidatus Marinimicrobia bacterium]|nr:protein BatD [Candidatus Neomarinimicrobiota bacterium]